MKRDWVSTAVRMHRRAEISSVRGELRLSRGYTRARNYAASKAEAEGADPWSAINVVIQAYLEARRGN